MAKTTKVKKQLANHILLAGTAPLTGDDAEDYGKATGYRYEDKASTVALDWDYDTASDFAKRSYAIFGFKTRATNVASQVRQKDENASGQAQVDAIRASVALIESGTWVDKSREGPSYDAETICWAAVDVAAAAGKVTDDAAKVKLFEQLLSKVLPAGVGTESDKAAIAKLRGVDGVEAAYRARKPAPKKSGSVDDLLAMANS
jgi:hypothetical protein